MMQLIICTFVGLLRNDAQIEGGTFKVLLFDTNTNGEFRGCALEGEKK